MTKLRICSCGKRVEFNIVCSCKETINRNEYQRDYYQKHKDTLKPLSSTRWKKLRSLIIKRDQGLCQRCLLKFGIFNGTTLQVHHMKPRIHFPELMFEESNLITLCKTCNLQIGLKELDFEPKTVSKENEPVDYDFKIL